MCYTYNGDSMKSKKGFTLVELLAVFTVLGIIASIAFVSVNKMRDSYDLNSFKESVKNILTTAQQKYASDGYTGIKEEGYTLEDLKFENKGQFISGTVVLENGKMVAVNIATEDYCANGPIDDLKIKEGNCPKNVNDGN